MRRLLQWLSIAGLALATIDAQAQIYTCTAPNGTRIFSEQKCGDDAKLVPGIELHKNQKKNAAKSAASAPKAEKTPPLSAPELAILLEKCNRGDMAACKKWTLGGGPNAVRTAEHNAELACEEGSLKDCEERYCKEGANEDCRQRVLRSAMLSGETWYLRGEKKPPGSDAINYAVRCIWKGKTGIRDVEIRCATEAGPQRCSTLPGPKAFARLDQAAMSSCAVK